MEEKLKELFQSLIQELKTYSSIQFGDSAEWSAIMELVKEFEKKYNDMANNKGI